MREIINKIKRYAKLTLIDNDIQVELKDDVKINMQYLQKLINTLKENKFEVVQIMRKQNSYEYLDEAHNQAMKEGYLYSKTYDELEDGFYNYEKQISSNSFIYIVNVSGVWTSYRQTDVKVKGQRERKIHSEKVIIEDSDLRDVLQRTEKYIHNYKAFINKAS